MKEPYFYTYNKDGSIRRKLRFSYKGNFAQNEYLHGVSCIIMVGESLLMTRRAKKCEAAGFMDFCSGHVEGKESGIEAMLRELKEEIGLNPNATDLVDLGRHTLYALNREREKNWLMDLFLLRVPTRTPLVFEEDEIEAIFMVPPASALKAIRNNRCQFNYDPVFEQIFAQITPPTSAK